MRLKEGVNPDPGDFLDIVAEKFNGFLEGLGFHADMVPHMVAFGHGRADPVDIETQQVEQFAAQNGDLRRVDAVRAEQGTSAAFAALKEIIPPFADHRFGQFPCPHHFPQVSAGPGKITAIHAPQQFRPQHRHVLGVAASDEKMALVRAGPAADTDIHENLQRSKPLKPLSKAFHDDIVPVIRQLPVVIFHQPVSGIGHAQGFDVFTLNPVAVHPLSELGGTIHPSGLRHFQMDTGKFFGFGEIRHGTSFPFKGGDAESKGMPASTILS